MEDAFLIDYAVLKSEMTPSEVYSACQEGVKLGVRTLCVNPCHLEMLSSLVAGAKTKLCPVTDFPFGSSSSAAKAAQIMLAANFEDVLEVDVVANYGLLRAGKMDEFIEDLEMCADACHEAGKELKVILETDALTLEQIAAGCEASVEAGVDFVKTSTGFYTGACPRGVAEGASEEVVKLMLDTVKGQAKVKASGKIRTREQFLKLKALGVARMGIGYGSVKACLGVE